MNIKSQLQQLCGDTEFLRLNDVNIEPERMAHIAFLYNDRAKPPYREIKVSNGIGGYCLDVSTDKR